MQPAATKAGHPPSHDQVLYSMRAALISESGESALNHLGSEDLKQTPGFVLFEAAATPVKTTWNENWNLGQFV